MSKRGEDSIRTLNNINPLFDQTNLSVNEFETSSKNSLDVSMRSNNSGNRKQSNDPLSIDNNQEPLIQKEIISNVISALDNSIDQHKSILITKEKIWNVVRQIKRNKKEFREKLRKDKWYVINPQTSIFKAAFDIVIMFLLLIDYVLSPFEFFVQYQEINSESFLREYVFDSIFLVELVINFFTGYYDFSLGFVITDLRKIAIHFIKYGFVFDLLSILPLYLIAPTLLLIRLIKLYRYPTVLALIKKYLNNFFSLMIRNLKIKQQIIQVILFFVSLVYILHICTCVYVFIGLLDDKVSWIHNFLFDSKSSSDRYIGGMYQITQTFTTTGYGDFVPTTNVELIFIMFCEIVNCGLFAYLLTCILEILTNKQETISFKYQNQRIDLQNWITDYMEKLPQSSKEKNLHRDSIWVDVKRFFDVFYFTERNFSWINRFDFMKQIKANHRTELLQNAFYNIKEKFKNVFGRIKTERSKNEIILNLTTQIEKCKYSFIEEKKKIKKIFFIEQGTISITKGSKEIGTLKEGDYFGFEGLIDSKSIYGYKVCSNCDFAIVYYLRIDYLIEEILNYDVDTYIEIIDIAKSSKKELILKEKEKKNEEEGKDILIDTNQIKNIFEIEDDDTTNNTLENIGIIPEKNKDISNLYENIKECDECEKRLDIITKQLSFIDKYLEKAI